jgi:hypothetical protein
MIENLEPNGESYTQNLSVLDVWRLALTRPNEGIYQRISDDPRASIGRAIGWIALSTGISYTISALAQLLLMQLFPLSSFLEGAEDAISGRLLSSMSTTFILACGLPFSVLVSTFGLLIFAGLIHFIAGALGGSGSFDRLVYVFAAISVPGAILSALLGLIPLVNCLTLPLALYILVLNMLAIKVVHKLSWGATMGSMMILFILFALIAVIIVLALWGPLQDFLRSPEFLPSELF